MKPFLHAQSSVRRYGGTVEDFLPIHDFMDSSKSAHASVKHRAVFHSAFGAFIVEKVFGHLTKYFKKQIPAEVQLKVIKLKAEIEELQNIIKGLEEPYVGYVSTRDVAEQHIIEDLSLLPSLDDYLSAMQIQEWMGGKGTPAIKEMKLHFPDGVRMIPPDITPALKRTSPIPNKLEITD